MLQVTQAAVSVLRQVIEHPEVPQNAVRIEPVQMPEGEQGIAFQPVNGPQQGDIESDAQGLDVFVAPELSAPLDHSILDARDTPDGTQIFVRPQEQG